MNLNAAITAYFFDKHDLTAHTRRDYEQTLRTWTAWTFHHTCERHPERTSALCGLTLAHIHLDRG